MIFFNYPAEYRKLLLTNNQGYFPNENWYQITIKPKIQFFLIFQLRGTDRVEAELTECQNSVQESIRGGSGGTFKDLGRSDVLRPLLVSVFLMFGQQVNLR